MFTSMWWWNRRALSIPWVVLTSLLGPWAFEGMAQPHRLDSLGARCGYATLWEQVQKDPHRLAQIQNERFQRALLHRTTVNSGRQEPEDGLPVLYLPVVVHVMHAPGDTVVGQGSNLSDEQIQSQLVALNHDFRRKMGTRGFNRLANGADACLQFVLASRDPQGNAHKGINRVPYEASMAHPMGADLVMKDLSRWPVHRYVNLWVVGRIQLGVLGYAWLPSMLAGDPQAGRADGVVISAQVTGSRDWIPAGTSFDLHPVYGYGRTLTHEMGHYLDLYHTWGDGDCTVDDEIEDTPNCDGPLFGCPSQAPVDCPPAPARMISNYMDYTDDACMNAFSVGQVQRMRQSLSSLYPWRAALTSDTNLASTGAGPLHRPNPSRLIRVFSGTTVCAVNDTLGGDADRIRLLDQHGLGLDSTTLALFVAPGDRVGLRVLTSQVQTDAFGFATYKVLSGPRPGLNQMMVTPQDVSIGGNNPVLILDWEAFAQARFYPNPVDDAAWMQWSDRDSVDFRWTLVDALGRIQAKGSYRGEAFWAWPWEGWPSGAWVLCLDYSTGVREYFRFIKR